MLKQWYVKDALGGKHTVEADDVTSTSKGEHFIFTKMEVVKGTEHMLPYPQYNKVIVAHFTAPAVVMYKGMAEE